MPGVDGVMEMELIQAAERGDVTRLDFLLQSGAPPNARWNGYTPLVMAALNSHEKCVSALLKSGADVDITDELGITALGHVTRLGHVTCILPLVRASVIMDFKRRFESTKRSHIQLLQELRNHKFETVNSMLLNSFSHGEHSLQEDFLNLILFLLISHNCPTRSLNLIIDLGAHVNANYRYGLTPLIVSTASGMINHMTVLLQKGADENLYDELCHMTPLLYASKAGNMRCVTLLLQNGPRTSDRDTQGRNALMHAVESGSEMTVELLLGKGYAINDVSTSGMTVLMHSARGGNISCMERLITEGCGIHDVDKEGKSSLIYAAETGQFECLALLIAKDCRVDEQDTWEKSALMYAAGNGQLACVRLLLTSGADVHHVDGCGKSALHFAAETGRAKCLEEILKYGCDVNAKDGMGVTAIMLTSLCGNAECVELLLGAGATAHGADTMSGRTALMYAARHGSSKCMSLLSKAGASQHDADNFGRTVLMYAAEGGNVECIDLTLGSSSPGNRSPKTDKIDDTIKDKGDIIRCFPDKRYSGARQNGYLSSNYVNCVDFRGMSALMLATRQVQVKAMRRLLVAGADVSIMSFSGETALSTAIYSENAGSIELLLQTEYYSTTAANKETPDCLKMAVRSSSVTILDILIQKGIFRWDWFDNSDIDFVKLVYPLAIDAGYPPGDFKANGHGVTLLGFSILHQDKGMAMHLLDLAFLSDKDLVSHVPEASFHTAAMLMHSMDERTSPFISWPLTLTNVSLVAISKAIGPRDHVTPRDVRIDTLPLPSLLKRKLQYRSGMTI